jgi:hypothetical protein
MMNPVMANSSPRNMYLDLLALAHFALYGFPNRIIASDFGFYGMKHFSVLMEP